MLAEYRRLKGLATLASRNYIQVGGGGGIYSIKLIDFGPFTPFF